MAMLVRLPEPGNPAQRPRLGRTSQRELCPFCPVLAVAVVSGPVESRMQLPAGFRRQLHVTFNIYINTLAILSPLD